MDKRGAIIPLILGAIVILLIVFGLGRVSYEFAKEKIFGERGILAKTPGEAAFVPYAGPKLTPEEATALNSIRALICAVNTVQSGIFDIAKNCPDADNAPGAAPPPTVPPTTTPAAAPTTPTGGSTGPLGWLLAITGLQAVEECKGAKYGQSCVECTTDPAKMQTREIEKDANQWFASYSVDCWNKFRHFKDDPVHCYQVKTKESASKGAYLAELAKINKDLAANAEWDLPDPLSAGDFFTICATDDGDNRVVLTKQPANKCKAKELAVGSIGCVVKRFELPQEMPETGAFDPATWIQGVGDPEFLTYYESFPTGEDVYWNANMLSMSAAVILISAGVNMVAPAGDASARAINAGVKEFGVKGYVKAEAKKFAQSLIFSIPMMGLLKKAIKLFGGETAERTAQKTFIKALIAGDVLEKVPAKLVGKADEVATILGPHITRKGVLKLDRDGLEKALKEGFEKGAKELGFFRRLRPAEITASARQSIDEAIEKAIPDVAFQQQVKTEFKGLLDAGLAKYPGKPLDAYKYAANELGGKLDDLLARVALRDEEKAAIKTTLSSALTETERLLPTLTRVDRTGVSKAAKEYADLLSGTGTYTAKEYQTIAALLRKPISKAQLRHMEKEETMRFVVKQFANNLDTEVFLKYAEAFGKLTPGAQKKMFKEADRFFKELDPKQVDVMLGKIERGPGAAKFTEFVGKSLNSMCAAKTVITGVVAAPVLAKLGVSPEAIAGGFVAMCGARAGTFMRDHKLIAILMLSFAAHMFDLQNQKALPHGENVVILHESAGGFLPLELRKETQFLGLIKDYQVGQQRTKADIQRFHLVSPCKADVLVAGERAASCLVKKGALDRLSLFRFKEGVMPVQAKSIEFSEALEAEVRQAAGQIVDIKNKMVAAIQQPNPVVDGVSFKENEWIPGKKLKLPDPDDQNYFKVLGSRFYRMEPSGKLYRFEEKQGWYPIPWDILQYDMLGPAVRQAGVGIWHDFAKVGGRSGWEYALTKDLQLFARNSAGEHQRYERGSWRKTTKPEVDAALQKSQGATLSPWLTTGNLGFDYYTTKYRGTRGFVDVHGQPSSLRLRTAAADYTITPETLFEGKTIKQILDERIVKARDLLKAAERFTRPCLEQGTASMCNIAISAHQEVMFNILAEDWTPFYSQEMLDLLGEVQDKQLALLDKFTATPKKAGDATKLRDAAQKCVDALKLRKPDVIDNFCNAKLKPQFDKFLTSMRFAEVLPEDDLDTILYHEAKVRIREKTDASIKRGLFQKELRERANLGKTELLVRPVGKRDEVLQVILDDLTAFFSAFDKPLQRLMKEKGWESDALNTHQEMEQLLKDVEKELRGILSDPQQSAGQLKKAKEAAQNALTDLEKDVLLFLATSYGIHKGYTNLGNRVISPGTDGKLRYYDSWFDPHTFVFLSMGGAKDLPFRREPPHGQQGPDAKYHHLAGELADMANLLLAVEEYYKDQARAAEARKKIDEHFSDADAKLDACMEVACSVEEGLRCAVPAPESPDLTAKSYLPCYEALQAYRDASFYFAPRLSYFDVFSEDEKSEYSQRAVDGTMLILSSADTMTKLFKMLQRFDDYDPGAGCFENNGWRAAEYRTGIIPGTVKPFCPAQSYNAVNRALKAYEDQSVFDMSRAWIPTPVFDDRGIGYISSLFYSPFFSALNRIAPHPAAEAGLRGIASFADYVNFRDNSYQLVKYRVNDELRGIPREGMQHYWTPYEIYAYIDLREQECMHAAGFIADIPALAEYYGIMTDTDITKTRYYEDCLLEIGSIYPELLELHRIYDGFAYRPFMTRVEDFDTDIIPVMRQIEKDIFFDDDAFAELLAKKTYFGKKERLLQQADMKRFLADFRLWITKETGLTLATVDQLTDDEFRKWVSTNNNMVNKYSRYLSGEKAVKECVNVNDDRNLYWSSTLAVYTPNFIEIDPNMHPYKDWNKATNYCYSSQRDWYEKYGEIGIIIVSTFFDPLIATVGGAVCAPAGPLAIFACSRLALGFSGAAQAIAAKHLSQLRAWPKHPTIPQKIWN